MKKMYYSLYLLCLIFSSGFIASAQSVGEECDGSNCDQGLNCVEVNIRGRRMELCSECTQSELNSLTSKVKEKCKYFKPGESFSLPKNPKYLDAISNKDGETPRVPEGIYDEILQDMKYCKTARTNRDDKCWDGGDNGHIQQVTDLTNAQRNIASTKRDDYDNQRIFYCSKSSYESAFGYYKSKCDDVNTSRIEDALERMESELNRGNEIDCSDLKEYISDCEDCRKKAYDLIRTAFDGSTSKTPDYVQSKMTESESLVDLGQEILREAESKDLCD